MSNVANEILAQLKFLAKDRMLFWCIEGFFKGPDYLRFIAKGVRRWYVVEIKYDYGRDLYIISFFQKSNSKLVKNVDGVYFDMMSNIIDDFLNGRK